MRLESLEQSIRGSVRALDADEPLFAFAVKERVYGGADHIDLMLRDGTLVAYDELFAESPTKLAVDFPYVYMARGSKTLSDKVAGFLFP